MKRATIAIPKLAAGQAKGAREPFDRHAGVGHVLPQLAASNELRDRDGRDIVLRSLWGH
jgi:hypothetical protein